MIKRLNFTGRKRISREHVQIEVYDGHPRPFSALITLDDTNLPQDAAVYLEATCAGSNVVQRFEFGTVGNIKPATPPKLTEIEGENVFFNLKVVDTSQRFGRILGLAENIRPERAGEQTASGRKGILPIEESRLDGEIWKLEFREQGVFLLVNKDIPGLVDRASSDPSFYALIYPNIVRHILARAIAENVDLSDTDDRWPVLWLRFARGIHPEFQAPPENDAAQEEIDEWVDEVVDSFCTKHDLRTKFVRAASMDGDNDR
jgi:hypothetical protein